MKKLILGAFIIGGAVMGSSVNAQNVLDGVYIKEHSTSRKVIPYTHLREADVMWSKRVWRVIDLREKMNQPLYYPVQPINDRRSMTQVVRSAVLEGVVTAYSSLDDEFKMPMTIAEVEAIGSKVDTIFVEDPETYELVPQIIKEEFEPSSVKRYRLKEDYFFDRQKSVLDVRTIGICPVRESYDENGEYRGDAPMFWIYYPEIRQSFANAEVYNRSNDSERRTLEDIYWKRWFASYIYKENNVYDRLISEYKEGLDALLEGKRIHEEIRDWEQDLWEY
jgi:gliding motility associated protien GldN